MWTLETEVLDRLRRKGLTISVAESCTGGRICDRLTDVPGSSDVFMGGLVAYSNRSKVEMLGVSEDTLRSYGAVSAECAREMAEGVRRTFGTDIGVSVTGIAGPSGGSVAKPVGLVYVGLACIGEGSVFKLALKGDRTMIKKEASDRALELAFDLIA